MEAIKLQRKYPHISQEEMLGLIGKFRQMDVDEKGSLDRAVVLKGVQDQERATYDRVRETLKDVSIDASGRVELEDYVDVSRRTSDVLTPARVAAAKREQC